MTHPSENLYPHRQERDLRLGRGGVRRRPGSTSCVASRLNVEREVGLFERAYLEQLLAGKLGGVRPHIGAKIWLLVTLEAWLRTVLARPLP